ncbi:bifunctional diguanylate cyclase/phosphodiesterase [Aurantimonas sp. A2-1-M11]|uniref:putative bifunctional diguanylate cyclase/phosphodiesterase n=1 Tax=Aurantimonas sp. A2-1-M11 TaxID=3113712 RepID=UPI002F939818
MVLFFQKNGLTVLGGFAIAGFVVFSALSIGGATVGGLIETEMRAKGQNFAGLLTQPGGKIDAFLTGLSRDPDAEADVRKLADLASIDSFAIFDRRGDEVYRSRSDRYQWLLRDRPGGIQSGSRLSESVLSKQGDWQVVEDDGFTNPTVITPLVRDGRTIGYVSLVGDMIANRSAYKATLAWASGILLVLIFFATAVPLLLYIRRKRKIAEADERIVFLANHDALTKLLNRHRMQEESDRVLATVRATRERMAYLYIDIDEMAEINDRFGQAAGDEMLRVVADRLIALVDRNDLLARLGADDFAILQRRVASQEDVAALCKRIVDAVTEPVEIAGTTLTPSVSIGCALAPMDGRTHSELVKHAELAHLHHKTDKSRNMIHFEPSMDEAMHHRRHIEGLVRKALENQSFELFYQPIVNSDGSRLLGLEALIRMRDEEGNQISPAVFIPIAEARGYIKTIGTWVIREAVRQIAQWPEHLFVSVNLSAVQFGDGDLLQIVQSALHKAGVDGSRLEIEVVESLVLERSEDILKQLRQLKALGIAIDMDDFGTGYSSLGYLWRFPFDKLKIDQSFMVAYENGEPNVPQILDTIVSMAHHMKMKVTAEGIETQEQVDLLKSLGCDQLQGYFFGKPMPAERVASDVLARFRDVPASVHTLPLARALHSR